MSRDRLSRGRPSRDGASDSVATSASASDGELSGDPASDQGPSRDGASDGRRTDDRRREVRGADHHRPEGRGADDHPAGGRIRHALAMAGLASLAVAGLAVTSLPSSVSATSPVASTGAGAEAVDDRASLELPDIVAGSRDRAGGALAASRAFSYADRPARLFANPVPGSRLSATFGERGQHWATRHTGLDFVAPWGAPVYAVDEGTVVALPRHPGYGRMVVIEVRPGVTVWYCHLSSTAVRLGPVSAGTRIGSVGSTGNATGAHLHLEVRVWDRPTDPAVFLWGSVPGRTSRPPSWLPAVPVTTVAALRRM
jgi:murein DD-endopeptidase MepM/ murein hydrolase activator NlpD